MTLLNIIFDMKCEFTLSAELHNQIINNIQPNKLVVYM
jgi:hypothetical protein